MLKHSEINERALRWLRSKNCRIAFSEICSCYVSEIPDALGFVSVKSILIESKSSRADFLRDKKKWHRIYAEKEHKGELKSCETLRGIGNWRFYFVNPGVVKSESEIPEGWGVYEIRGNRVYHLFGVKYANGKTPPFKSNLQKELCLLISYTVKQEDSCEQ